MVVVDAVDDEVEPAAQGVIRLPVEDEPVQPVLGQGPDQEAELRPAAPAEPRHSPLDPPRATRPATTTGTKMIAGTEGWIRENRSSKRFSKEARGGAQPGGSLVCHRSPDFNDGHSAQRPRPDARAGRFAPVGPDGRRPFPQTTGNRARRRSSKSRGMRECVLRGPRGGAIIAAPFSEVTRGSGVDSGRAPGDADGGGDRAAKRRATKRRKGRPSCEDCFFHRQMLCALDLDEPCSTFRPNSADGLVPPRQPALLLRQPPEEAAATTA